MGGSGSGRRVNGGEVVDRLEDARFPLVDALETVGEFTSVLNRAGALLQRLERLLLESQTVLIAAERTRGATHFRGANAARIDGLTITTLDQPRRAPVHIPLADRIRIVARRRAGETLEAIGNDYGVSKQRIAQIVERRQRHVSPAYADTIIAGAMVDAIRDDSDRPLLDALHQLEGHPQLQENHNGHGGAQ